MPTDRRVLIYGLLASVLLNLFLGGLILGGGLPRRVAPGTGALAPAAKIKRLPQSERARFAAAMGPHRAEIRAARARLRQARAKAAADIAAPQLNVEALRIDLAALRAANLAQQEASHRGLIDALAALSPQSRAALVGPLEPGVGNSPGVR
jgi:uncharacterized membrane protein